MHSCALIPRCNDPIYILSIYTLLHAFHDLFYISVEIKFQPRLKKFYFYG